MDTSELETTLERHAARERRRQTVRAVTGLCLIVGVVALVIGIWALMKIVNG